jgi:hypothetical protein
LVRQIWNDPIPSDLIQAFEEAVTAFVAWYDGDEPHGPRPSAH